MSGSLSTFPGFVPQAAFQFGPSVAFAPEVIDLQNYTFVPWVRTGLATQLKNPQNPPSLRATVDVSISVVDDAGGSSKVSKTLTLRGPGDVVGIDPTQIVRRYPQPNSLTAEESCVAHVEFDRPELPWLFTPIQPPKDQVPPWIALVVVEERLFQLRQGATGLPRQFTTKLRELQPLNDSWAWAHAQVLGTAAGAPSVADRLTDAYGAANLSRVLCPRKLDKETSYVACVVPAFDCGVKAGLGQHGGTLEPAWTRVAGDDNQDITLPVYDYWSFRIAPAGDFESLARKLVGVPAPWQIGRRIIDCSNPRGGMTALAAEDAGRVQILECALHSLAPAPPELEPSAWSTATRQALADQVNLSDQALDLKKATDLPRVSPRLYARYQRAQSRLGPIGDSDWFSQLNTTPTQRIVAGLGTRVVQKDQEPLMQAAWAQVGEIDKVNQRLSAAQFARFAAESLHKNHLGKLSLGDLAQVTRAVQGKLVLGGAALTVAGTVARSATPPAALTGAFRRSTRVRGPLTRFFGSAGAKAIGALVAVNETFQDFRRVYKEPDGIAVLSDNAFDHFKDTYVALTKNQPADFKATATKSVGRPSVADQLVAPSSTWHVPAGNIDLGSIGANRVLDLYVAAAPPTVAAAPVRSGVLVDILAGISTSGLAAPAARAATLASQIGLSVASVSGDKTTVTTSASIAKLAASPVKATVTITGPHAGVSILAAKADNVTRPGVFNLTIPARAISSRINVSGNPTFAQASTSLSTFMSGLTSVSLTSTPELPKLAIARTELLAAIHPRKTVTAYMTARLGPLPSWLPKDWFDDGFVQPIMRAPTFERPMYEALDSYDREWLIPGLGAMHQTDLVTLLETNPAFTEAFLVGLSDEMGRELLWRGYPTDCRGTYFKRFWMPDRDELDPEIHLFAPTPLGTHISSAAGGAAGRIVMLVRGELIRRYPHAVMLAQRQMPDVPGKPTFAAPPPPGATGSVLFQVPLAPDIIIVGFRLTELDLESAGGSPWWFVLSEHPGAPRFGLDLPADPPAPLPAIPTRDDVTWATFGPLAFGRFLSTTAAVLTVKDPSGDSTVWDAATLHGGGVARVLLQDPFRAAWNSLKLIGPAKS